MKTRSFTSRIAWLAILAIMWHAMLPLAHAASSQQGIFSSICSVEGPREELLSLPTGKQDAPGVDLLKQCPLCATGAHFAIADIPGTVFRPDSRLSHAQPVASVLVTTPALAWLNFSARAPPLSA